MLVQITKFTVIARNHPSRFPILAISLLTTAKYYHCGRILIPNPENYGMSLGMTAYLLLLHEQSPVYDGCAHAYIVT